MKQGNKETQTRDTNEIEEQGMRKSKMQTKRQKGDIMGNSD